VTSLSDLVCVLRFDASPLLSAIGRARSQMERFASALRQSQERAYLTEHPRLPGSTRTARLRKKRRDTVARWWEAQP
jgi:hypothetical protein